jgi:large subunit ribosomal protein L32
LTGFSRPVQRLLAKILQAVYLRLSRLTHRSATVYLNLSINPRVFCKEPHPLKNPPIMANPKRKQSKRRSANRRAANAFKAPEFAKDPTDGSTFRPHRVNPKNGMYRGRQVLHVEV